VTTPVRLKLMWDYDAFPVWNDASNDPPVNVKEIPISDELRRQLQAWSDEGTDLAWGEREPTSRLTKAPSEMARRAWEVKGRDLLHQLRDELGRDYLVGYFDPETRETVWDG